MEAALSILMLWSYLLAIAGAGGVIYLGFRHRNELQTLVRRSRVLTGRSAETREATAKELAVFAELQSERATLEREQQALRARIRAAITPPAPQAPAPQAPAPRAPEAGR